MHSENENLQDSLIDEYEWKVFHSYKYKYYSNHKSIISNIIQIYKYYSKLFKYFENQSKINQ